MGTNLNPRQIDKLDRLLLSIDLDNVNEAIVLARKIQLASNVKKARKALATELAKIDKALALYGIDIALDAAMRIIEARDAERAKVSKGF
jgi:hypothetical protein